jgi:hypothetical protein
MIRAMDPLNDPRNDSLDDRAENSDSARLRESLTAPLSERPFSRAAEPRAGIGG